MCRGFHASATTPPAGIRTLVATQHRVSRTARDPRTLGLRREHPDTRSVSRPAGLVACRLHPWGWLKDPAEVSPPQQLPCLSARRHCSGVRCTSPRVSSAMARILSWAMGPSKALPRGSAPRRREPSLALPARCQSTARAASAAGPAVAASSHGLPQLPAPTSPRKKRRRRRGRGGPPECCSTCGWPGSRKNPTDLHGVVHLVTDPSPEGPRLRRVLLPGAWLMG
jgi:hypothetical protein